MNGLEFLHVLRKLPGGAAPRVLFCTTENDMEHIQKAIEAGADVLVAGTATFAGGSKAYAANITRLRGEG